MIQVEGQTAPISQEIRKSAFHGWQAESIFLLQKNVRDSEGKIGDRILSVSTSKRHSGQVKTCASVSIKFCDGSKVTEIFGDFSKWVAPMKVKVVNEKAVCVAHLEALKLTDDLIREATAFYEKSEAA